MHLMMVAQKRIMYKRRSRKEKERQQSFLAVLCGGLSFPLLRHAKRELDVEVLGGEFAGDEAEEELVFRHTAVVEVNERE